MARFVDQALFADLSARACSAERKRSHFNLHNDLADPLQRLCIALTPGTYIRPHFHPAPKIETLIVLKGQLVVMLFDHSSVLTHKILLKAGGDTVGVEIPAHTLHSMYPINGEAIFFETKLGPFVPTAPEEFAAWAPPEGDERVEKMLQWFYQATAGDRCEI